MILFAFLVRAALTLTFSFLFSLYLFTLGTFLPAFTSLERLLWIMKLLCFYRSREAIKAPKATKCPHLQLECSLLRPCFLVSLSSSRVQSRDLAFDSFKLHSASYLRTSYSVLSLGFKFERRHVKQSKVYVLLYLTDSFLSFVRAHSSNKLTYTHSLIITTTSQSVFAIIRASLNAF